MDVFTIKRYIRQVGYNSGVPCWLVEFGLGNSYTPEDLLRKLAALGMREKDWVVAKNALTERGVGTFIDALGHVHCRSEVLACGRDATPAWFTKADRWTVLWDGSPTFNFGALRRGQDMIIATDLSALVEKFGSSDRVEKALVTSTSLSEADLLTVFAYKIRVFAPEEGEDD